MPGRIAGETVGRRRAARLRAHAADARAAHPPREGDLEHLHRAGAQRARRRRLPGLARAARDRRARRAAAGAHALRARDARRAATGVEKLHEQPVVREFALRLDADVAAVRRRCAGAGRQPGRRPARAQRSRSEDRGGLLVAITERRSRADIDRLAEVLRRRRRGRARGGAGMSAIDENHLHADPGIEATTRTTPPAPPRPARCSASAPDDLPEGRARAPRVRVPAARRAGAPTLERAAARALSPRASRRGCPRSPSPRSCATTSASPSATSTSTRASTRSARAR